MKVQYWDAKGGAHTLTPHQTDLLQRVNAAPGQHLQSEANDTLSARLLAERGVLTMAEWHCPLNPWCITGLTFAGKILMRQVTR